jgi:hypothetical protein
VRERLNAKSVVDLGTTAFKSKKNIRNLKHQQKNNNETQQITF